MQERQDQLERARAEIALMQMPLRQFLQIAQIAKDIVAEMESFTKTIPFAQQRNKIIGTYIDGWRVRINKLITHGEAE